MKNRKLAVIAYEVPYGYIKRRKIPGYVLEDNTVLLETEKDEKGRYIGGAGMDGLFIKTPRRFFPEKEESGKIITFYEDKEDF